MYPFESLIATTFAPNDWAFWTAYIATFPDPDTTTLFPSIVFPASFNISSTKYTNPYPVASVLAREPPKVRPFPVKTPWLFAFLILLYWPYK